MVLMTAPSVWLTNVRTFTPRASRWRRSSPVTRNCCWCSPSSSAHRAVTSPVISRVTTPLTSTPTSTSTPRSNLVPPRRLRSWSLNRRVKASGTWSDCSTRTSVSARRVVSASGLPATLMLTRARRCPSAGSGIGLLFCTGRATLQAGDGEDGAGRNHHRVLDAVGVGDRPPPARLAVVGGGDPVEGLAHLHPVHPLRLGRARGRVLRAPGALLLELAQENGRLGPQGGAAGGEVGEVDLEVLDHPGEGVEVAPMQLDPWRPPPAGGVVVARKLLVHGHEPHELLGV